MRNRSVSLALVLAALAGTSATAGTVRQLTDAKAVSFDWPMLDGTGAEVFLVNSSDQFGGGNPRHLYRVVAFDPTTGTGTPLTTFESSLTHVRHNLSVSADGQWLALISDGDLVPGQNGNRSPEVFIINRDGTQLSQLTDDSTPNAGSVTRLALAGSGNRIAFASSSDLTGGNPNRVQQVFVIDADGTNLTQMTQATEGEIQHMWVSNDGTRIAFSHNGDLTGGNPEKNYEIFTIAVGDTLPRQVTSSITGDSRAANISGDGGTIVFHSTADLTGGNADGGLEIFAADWTTATVSQVTDSVRFGQPREARMPWPTDNGQQIFFSSNAMSVVTTRFDAYKINTDGTGRTRLTNLQLDVQHPVVSGDGSQFAAYTEEGLYTGTGSGSNLLELVDRRAPFQAYTDLSADGQWVSFTSDADPFGTNPENNQEAFVVRSDGTGLTQLTTVGGLNYFGAGNASINGGGSRIYFESSADLVPGQNTDLSSEIFGIDTDGTGLMQYSFCVGGPTQFSVHAEVSDDGNTVAFVSLCDLTGGNPDFTGEIHLIDPDGQNLRQITSGPSVVGLTTYVYWPRLDATGTWVVFSGNNDLDGGNPDNGFEVWRMRTDGTNLERLTTDAVNRFSLFPDISGDGSRIVFQSQSDITGQNADHNQEIFLYEPGAATPMRQLTQTTEGSSTRVRLTRDGAYAYFFSTSQFLEDDPDTGRYYLYRYHIDTDTIERASGLIFESTEATYHPGINTDGSKVVFAVFGDGTGDNPDDYWEIQLADYNEPNPPVISPGPAPTTVSFEPQPGIVRYDVIRGDVSELQDVGGGIIDLGAVTCVENDSADTTTAAGYDDQVTPAVGQAFFYVYRGSMGMNVGPGSYGTGSNGSERVPGVGGCIP